MARLSVLIIEHEPSDLRSLSEFLTHRELDVHSAADGPQGLKKAREVQPDLILLSVELPTINGYIVCKNLKRDPLFAKTPLFLLSSTATQKDFELHQRLRIRAQEYFIKPYNLLDLWQRICLHLKIDPETLEKNLSAIPSNSALTPPPRHNSKGPIFGATTPVPHPGTDEMFVDPSPSARDFFPDPPLRHTVTASISSTHSMPDGPLQQKLDHVQKRLASREKRVAELEHALARQKRLHNQDRETLELELRAHQKNLKVLEQQLQNTTREAHEQHSALEQRLQQRTKEYETMSAQHQRLSEQVQSLEERAQTTKTQLETLERDLKTAQETHDRLQKQAEAAEQNAERAETQAGTLRTDVESLQAEAIDLQTQLDTSLNRVAELEAKIDSRKNSASSLEEKLAETRTQADQLDTQRNALEDTLEQIRSIYQTDVKTLFASIHTAHEAYGTSQENLQHLFDYTNILEDRLTSLSMVFGKLTNMLLNSARSLESNQELLSLPDSPVLVELPNTLHTPRLTPLPDLALTDPEPFQDADHFSDLKELPDDAILDSNPTPPANALPNLNDLLSSDVDLSASSLSWDASDEQPLHTVQDLEVLALDDNDPLAGFAEDMAASLAAMDVVSLDDVEEWASDDEGLDPLITSSPIPNINPEPLEASSQFDLEVLSVSEEVKPPPAPTPPSAPPVDLDDFVAQVGKTLNAPSDEEDDDLLSDLLDPLPEDPDKDIVKSADNT